MRIIDRMRDVEVILGRTARLARGKAAVRDELSIGIEDRIGAEAGGQDVGPGLWSRLEVGKAVNVRQADGESVTARLDENPQWGVAIAEMGFASLFLGIAALISGRWKPRARTKYMTAPAVVMAVEPVKYRDTTRWKVRFAYFDGNGDAQESADEVTQPTWKAGDDCIAVYRPDEPDLATLQPPHHA